jgi:fluoride exporter
MIAFMALQQMFLLVGIGLAGAVGALTRYTVGLVAMQRTQTHFPWNTLIINITGSFLIGLISGLISKKVIDTQTQAILATGFLGGYTTFSTMSWEGVQLMRGGSLRQSILYLAGNLVPGLLAAALGLALGGLF